jgi:hypothetical membrane protein
MLKFSESSRLVHVGAAGVASFFVASIITGALNPGYSHAREAVSALAATDARFAWIMITGFMLSAVGMSSTGVALWRRFVGNRAARVGAGILMIAGPLMVVAGVARQDCSERLSTCVDHGEGTGASTHFWVHQYVSLLLFVLVTVALFVLARGLRREAALSHLAVPTRVAGLFCLLVIVVMIVDEMKSIDAYAGLAQRAFVLVQFGWPVVVAAAAGPRLPRARTLESAGRRPVTG